MFVVWLRRCISYQQKQLAQKDCADMPPHADQLLEERILKAAQRLWRTRGEHGLTLRAVAREAGSTTPTVYNASATSRPSSIPWPSASKRNCMSTSLLPRPWKKSAAVISHSLRNILTNTNSFGILGRTSSPRPAASGSRVAAHPIRESLWRKARRVRARVLRHVSARPWCCDSTQCHWR